jgi:hypothetical protein
MSGMPEVRNVDSDLERQRLLFVLSEALEKLSRLQQILERQQVFITAEQVEGESASAVDTLIGYLEEHCQNFLANSDLVASILQRKPLNKAQQDAVIAALALLVTGILRVHELLLLLPREAAKPQASFLLRDCFGLRDLKASIVLTNLLSAYEYRFEDVLKKVNVEQNERKSLTQGGNVLCQAFVDKDNPLAWAVLAHEYGHALDDSHRISQEIVLGADSGERPKPEENSKLAWPVDVVAETVADFIAAHVLGPASLMPIMFGLMMQPRLRGVTKESAGHPPTPLRARLVCKYLKSISVTTTDVDRVFEAFRLDYEQKLLDMEKKDRDDVEEMGRGAEKLLGSLADVIASKVGSLGLKPFDEGSAETARVLRETLELKQPISSQRRGSAEEIFAELSSLQPGETTPEQAYRVLTKLDEVPVAASEIVTAGWLYRLSSFEGVLKKTFPGAGRGADIRIYSDYVKKTDDMLQKSLELVAVHTEVRRRLAPT